MYVLCLDIGSGTQDVLLLNTAEPAENAVQLVLPAPTVLTARKIEAATKRGVAIVLTGETMGGGASTGALRKHLAAGLKAYATPLAARTFDDDLDEVASWGVRLVSDEEVKRLKGVAKIVTGDIDLGALKKALSCWDVKLEPDVIAVAVLDHGEAPAGESDRVFRFKHMERRLQMNPSLESFIFTPAELPDYLTRMQAVARSIQGIAPLVLMDTGAAAVLGASLDRVIARHRRRLCVNTGNSHAIAFYLDGLKVLGLFEHHTSLLSTEKLDVLLENLVSGEASSSEIQAEGGHGAVILERGELPIVAVTGPRRQIMAGSRLSPYFAAPFGSMMLVGCFGLAKAAALKLTEWREEIEQTLIVK